MGAGGPVARARGSARLGAPAGTGGALAWGSGGGPGRAGGGLPHLLTRAHPHRPPRPRPALSRACRSASEPWPARPRSVGGWGRVFGGHSVGLSTGAGLSGLSWSPETGKSPAGLAGPAAKSARRQYLVKRPLSGRTGALAGAPRPPLPARVWSWCWRGGPAASRGGEEGCLCAFELLFPPSHPRSPCRKSVEQEERSPRCKRAVLLRCFGW